MEYALVIGASSGNGIVVISNRHDENEKVADAIEHDFHVETFPLYADLTKK